MDRELDNAGFSSRNLPGHSTDSQLPEGGAPASGRGGGGGGRPVALRGNSNSGRAREDEELAGGGGECCFFFGSCGGWRGSECRWIDLGGMRSMGR
jgi:hypothetical protein